MFDNKKDTILLFITLILVFIAIPGISASENFTLDSHNGDNNQIISPLGMGELDDAQCEPVNSGDSSDILNSISPDSFQNLELSGENNILASDLIYVNAASGDDNNNGKSFSNAYKTISFAIDHASSGSTIYLSDGIYKLSSPLIINKNLKIIGQSQDKTIIDANGHQGITVNKNCIVELSLFTISNAKLQGDNFGAAIENFGNLNVRSITVKDNTGNRSAGIDNDGGILTVVGCYFINNSALGIIQKHGNPDGAALSNTGTAYVYNSVFINNHADRDGGAIKNIGKLIVNGSTFINNTANMDDGYGGAIYTWAAVTEVYNSHFINSSGQYGGAIAIDKHDQAVDNQIIVMGNTFINNTEASRGGAIYVDRSVNSTINYNIFINSAAQHANDSNNASDNSIIGSGVFSDKETTNRGLNIENNYWGSNDFKRSYVSSNIQNPNDYLVLNIDAKTFGVDGADARITFDLTGTKNGNNIDGSLLPSNIFVGSISNANNPNSFIGIYLNGGAAIQNLNLNEGFNKILIDMGFSKIYLQLVKPTDNEDTHENNQESNQNNSQNQNPENSQRSYTSQNLNGVKNDNSGNGRDGSSIYNPDGEGTVGLTSSAPAGDVSSGFDGSEGQSQDAAAYEIEKSIYNSVVNKTSQSSLLKILLLLLALILIFVGYRYNDDKLY
ncbi:hypothetical protein [Methanobrevibacter sp.]|uniref:hypothetical protein n=1 Tax=Methanobrevibacter sp. TaxID=66852 RepID=UPI0038640B5C